MSDSIRLSNWKYRVVILSVVFSAVGYLAFSLWGGWGAVSSAAAKVGVLGISVALLMSSLNYWLRFIRWQGYLKSFGHRVPWRDSLRIYLSGFALTTTPGKAGEALRGVLLKPWGVPFPQSFAAFFSERLSDLFAVVLLTLFGLSLYPGGRVLVIVGLSLVLMCLVFISQRKLITSMAALISEQGGKISGLLRNLLKVLLEAQRCHKLGMLFSATILSIVAWSAEAFAFYYILNLMGAEISFEFAVFVYALSMLAGALSFMPGGLGGAEAVMVSLLVWKGLTSADAIAATILIRLATLWFAVVIGAVELLVLENKQRRKV